MATITAYASMDVRNFDFSSLYNYSNYQAGSNLAQFWYDNGFMDEFRGSGFTNDYYGTPNGGTVKSYATYYDGYRMGVIDGISVPVTKIADAAATYSTSDDQTIIRSALAGADKFTGSEYADYFDGFSGNDTLYGNGGNDTLFGNSGNDYLNGGVGIDDLRGGAGNDVYVVDNVFDTVNESVTGSTGIDTVHSSISFNLANTPRVLGSVENLTLLGSGKINGTGNSLNNVVTGNNSANMLNGAAGNDTINGGGGNDFLYGGAGNDKLTGGAGNDTFVFNTKISAASNVDTITDFNVMNDTIWLDNAVMSALGSAIESGEFWKSASGTAHDKSDHIIYETDTGWLNYDSNGSLAGGSVHIAKLDSNLELKYGDFLVI
ncbi:Ca2+-binding RTX toxin-like protein [Pararhizobium capsulatum DSM 1112]|uniref:Ca2+-binding RTX toxin-like protein n=1 Tax=Pararhizobium capsulatum DSM 1112 TaxID=1121113 RepID=A0ABU0C094_9HYPH|nr:calcium-binding protein [Pararhizobium capsulatum]MDQ0323379.1 Ca2+-binding RTX toxin-like protein [Pararhizobium capsulatum DSM 1112]